MSEEELKCNFCGKGNRDKTCLCLVGAPDDTFICDECVESARDIVGFYRGGGNKTANIGKNVADDNES